MLEAHTPSTGDTDFGGILAKIRKSSGKSARDCADFLGISLKTYHRIEDGKILPSLPEVEALSYFLLVQPRDLLEGQPAEIKVSASKDQIKQLIQIRHRIISATLQLKRANKKITLKSLSEQTKIPAARIKRYENSAIPIPLNELKPLASSLEIDLDSLLDQGGFLYQWREQEESIRTFLQLPQDLKNFISTPDNQEFLSLALRLKETGIENLAELASSLQNLASKTK